METRLAIERRDIRLTKRMAGSLKKTSRIVLAYMCDWPCAAHGNLSSAEAALNLSPLTSSLVKNVASNRSPRRSLQPGRLLDLYRGFDYAVGESRCYKVASACTAEIATSGVPRAIDDNVDR
jgi:hypothetical protein